MKKYGLHCFNCGELFHNKKEVYRKDGYPYCGECMYFSEYYEEDPRSDQEIIDEANIAKYGEY